MGDGLQDVPISCHVADCPLAQPSTAQPEDVAERKKNSLNTLAMHKSSNMFNALWSLTLGLSYLDVELPTNHFDNL